MSLSLETLIQQGENIEIEFKSDKIPLSDAELLWTVVCFANSGGGKILIGVEDDGTITGLHPKHQTRPELLAAFIASKTVPPVLIEVKFETVIRSRQDYKIAIVEVQSSASPVATSDGRMAIRFQDAHGKPGCRPFYPHEISSWFADRGQRDFSSQMINGATWNDFDPLEFLRLRNVIETYRGERDLLILDDVELARALGLVISKDKIPVPTVAGLLLVGREAAITNYLPVHEVAFQVLRNTDVLVNDLVVAKKGLRR